MQELYNYGTWKELHPYFSHRELGPAARQIPTLVHSGLADNSNKKYDSYFNKFREWCKFNSLQSLPASASTVCLYISTLVIRHVSESVLEAHFYSIKRFHDVALRPNPCSDDLVKLCLEGSKRMLSKPVNKKQPVTVEMLNKIVDKFGRDSATLSDLRICTLCLLGFSGFFRFSELSNILLKDLVFSETHVEIFVRKSKTDIYRRGNKVLIAKTGNKLCPVSFLLRYIRKAELNFDTEEFLFTSIRFMKKSNLYKIADRFKPLSYTRAREIFLATLTATGYDKSLFCLHSLRSGGVSAAAQNNVSDRLLRAHGRWRSDKSKDGYIQDNLYSKLAVSRNLDL